MSSDQIKTGELIYPEQQSRLRPCSFMMFAMQMNFLHRYMCAKEITAGSLPPHHVRTNSTKQETACMNQQKFDLPLTRLFAQAGGESAGHMTQADVHDPHSLYRGRRNEKASISGGSGDGAARLPILKVGNEPRERKRMMIEERMISR